MNRTDCLQNTQAVCDQTLFLSGVDLGEDELDPAYGVPAYN